MTTDGVYANKKSFLDGQVRRLTVNLAPSRQFKAAAASAEDNERLSDTVVENAVYRGAYRSECS
jgi:Kinetochore complex Fta4 of Sim4 subunit, or CENP-50